MFCFVLFYFVLIYGNGFPLCSPPVLCLHQYSMSTHSSPFVLLLPTKNQLSLSPRSSPDDCQFVRSGCSCCSTHTKGVRSLSDVYFSSLASAICRTQNLTGGDDQALLTSVYVARLSLRRYGGVTWCVITLSLQPVGIWDPLYKIISPEEMPFDQLVVMLTINSGGPGFSDLIQSLVLQEILPISK